MSDVNIWVDEDAPVRIRTAAFDDLDIRFTEAEATHSIGLHLPRDVAHRLHAALGEHLTTGEG